MSKSRRSSPIEDDVALMDAPFTPHPSHTPAADEAAPERLAWEDRIEGPFLKYAADRARNGDSAMRSFTSAEAFTAGGIEEPADPNWHGLFVSRLHREHLLDYAGFDTSHRSTSKGSALRKWVASERLVTSLAAKARVAP